MGPYAFAFSYSQERIVNADIIGNNEVISQVVMVIALIGPYADPVLFIVKDKIVIYYGISGGMPQINATASIVIGNIIDDMASGIRMINSMHIFTQFGIGAPNVKHYIPDNVVVMGLKI